jgi:hypothetical protein
MSKRIMHAVRMAGKDGCTGLHQTVSHRASSAAKVPSRPLREILCAQLQLRRRCDDRERYALHFRIEAMQWDTERAFAALNGWRVGTRVGAYRGWNDHGVRFNRNRRLVAIIGQPYGSEDAHIEELDTYAHEHGMHWQVPPMPRASFWFPGSTLFYVMTKLGVGVRWLPEQESETGFAEDRKLERSILREWTREETNEPCI